MNRLSLRLLLPGILLLGSLGSLGSVSGAEYLRLATTISTENSGLLAELLPFFERASDCQVDVLAVGPGQTLKLGESGDVDMLPGHACNYEAALIAMATAAIDAT